MILSVLGIAGLALLTIPSFFNQVTYAPNSTKKTVQDRQSELDSLWLIGAVLMNQQTFFLERGRFAKSISELEGASGGISDIKGNIVITNDTDSYQYKIISLPDPKVFAVLAIPSKPQLNRYIGYFHDADGDSNWTRNVCEDRSSSRTLSPQKILESAYKGECLPGGTPIE